MNRIKQLLMSTLLMVFSLSSHAYDFEVDGIYYNIVSISDLTCEITCKEHTRYSSDYTGNFTIPSKVRFNGKELTVIGIGEGAFYGCKDLKTVFIPSTITYIENYSFYGCTKLEELSIPSSVTKINRCCEECTNLKRINIESIDSWCKIKFSDYSFDYHNLLSITKNLYVNGNLITDLVIPSSVTEIKDGAFYGCTSISSLSFENGSEITSIGAQAFKDCKNLKKVTFPGSLTYLGSSSFLGIDDLESIVFQDGSEYLTYGTKHFAGDGTPPFEDSKNLQYVYIGRKTRNRENSTTQILGYWNGSQSFTTNYKSANIKELVIGECFTEFTQNVFLSYGYNIDRFYGISYESLNKITFGSNLQYISVRDLKQADSLVTIFSKSTVPPTLEYGFSNKTYMYATLYVPKGSKALYETTDGWNTFWNIQEYDSSTDIESPETRNSDASYCVINLNGTKAKRLGKGINIIKYSDGTVKKILK